MKQYVIIKNIICFWSVLNSQKLIFRSKTIFGQLSREQVVELLEIAKGYLPRVEYDRLKAEINMLEASFGIYQRFVDRNIELKKREGELQQSINELQTKKAELQKGFDESISKFHDNKPDDTNPHPEVKYDNVVSQLTFPPTTIVRRYIIKHFMKQKM
ncbi:MAG TPA: hypothetical protein VE130_13455 [Nitrososphaeraceae archaeon]|nr:hypothetical protein [Nitrososphaeraceae archaeon]